MISAVRDAADQLLLQVTAFADAATVPAAGDLSGPVATCPGWSVRDLVRHLGQVHRRVTTTISAGSPGAPARDTEMADGEPPASRDEVATWLLAGGTALVEAMRSAGPEWEVDGFAGPVPVSFWVRRQLHETLVHRLDAELAVGVGPLVGVSPELAADGVLEWYDLITAFRSGSRRLRGAGETIHVHATDEPSCELLVHRGSEGVTISREHARADVAVRGPAAALLGVVTNRLAVDASGPLGAVEVLGDAGVLRDWLRASAL